MKKLRLDPSEEAETCNADESVDHVLHSVVDNEDNYQHKTGEVHSHDNLSVVIYPSNLNFSRFESHYDCYGLKENFVAV